MTFLTEARMALVMPDDQEMNLLAIDLKDQVIWKSNQVATPPLRIHRMKAQRAAPDAIDGGCKLFEKPGARGVGSSVEVLHDRTNIPADQRVKPNDHFARSALTPCQKASSETV